MKLPLAIVAPLLTSLGALRPIRRTKLNHGAIVYKTLAVGRTYVVQEGCIRLIHVEGDGRTNFWDLIAREFPTWEGGGVSRAPSVARLVL